MNRDPSQPPALAAWLLRHLVPPRHRETLAGDLFECFGKGMPARWFWRQSLVAVAAGAASELNLRRPQIYAALAGLALPWSSSWIMRSAPLGWLQVWGVSLPWPLSVFYQFILLEILRAAMILLIFAALMLVTRRFNWTRAARATLVVLGLLAIGDILQFCWLCWSGSISYSLSWTALVFKEARFFLALLIPAWITCPVRPQIS